MDLASLYRPYYDAACRTERRSITPHPFIFFFFFHILVAYFLTLLVAGLYSVE
jgi:hypothetical protein